MNQTADGKFVIATENDVANRCSKRLKLPIKVEESSETVVVKKEQVEEPTKSPIYLDWRQNVPSPMVALNKINSLKVVQHVNCTVEIQSWLPPPHISVKIKSRSQNRTTCRSKMTTTSSRKTIEKAGRKISGPRCCPHLTDDDVIRSKTPRCSKMGEYVQYGYDSVTTSTPDLQYPRREVGSARYDGTFGEITYEGARQVPD
ncbi:hypothetical protein KSW81_002662 [Nannochloris sp. 'desiccata']|nr:hypothetical protein KSW81_002662 [Chlorella desiccata (nom. nud.)]